MSASSTRDGALRQAQLIAAIELFLIPGLDMMTTRQAAEFYEVDKMLYGFFICATNRKLTTMVQLVRM